MMTATALDALGEENTTTCLMQKDWMVFTFYGKYPSSGIHAFFILTPLIFVYYVPLGMYFLGCFINLLIHIYKKKNNIQEDMSSKSWEKARKAVINLMISLGKIWHDYEVFGMEHIPEGPGLIIYYHGAVAIDYSCFVSTLYMQTGRLCCSLVDHVVCVIPGIKSLLQLASYRDYSKAECVELMKKGKLLGIPPGGLREQNFSDSNYSLLWGNRIGFAQVALEAKVPIIPMFTPNIREAFWTVGNTRLTRWFYEHNRWLFLPVCGWFPVKLRTYIGEPIPYDPNITAEELAEKTKAAIENLRDRHQRRPGDIKRAVLERFDKHHKDN